MAEGTINSEVVDFKNFQEGGEGLGTPVLLNEIEGVETTFTHLFSNGVYHLPKESEHLIILTFFKGKGEVLTREKRLLISGISVFAPKPGNPATVKSIDDPLIFFETKIPLDKTDKVFIKEKEAHYPYFVNYHQSKTYRDYFKSKKTVSRTLVPPFFMPRFCMGSVESTGPDRIEPHAHPILDQLFFSLPENECTLLIDEKKQVMKGNTLLHIPLGSNHGVDVEPNKKMHYLWLDFFKKTEDMEYIEKVHEPTEPVSN